MPISRTRQRKKAVHEKIPFGSETGQRKKAKKAEQEKIPFARDVSQLLEKMKGIPHVYKEDFLWELVANANKALFWLRVRTLYEDVVADGPKGLSIDIIIDKSNHTLSIVDNGFGMTDDCLKSIFATTPKNLMKYNDTIDLLKKKKMNVNEFYELYSVVGLGLFSAFMVSDSIQITTKCHGGRGKQSTLSSSLSDDGHFFSVKSVKSSSSTSTGTKVTLQLNKDHFEYLDGCRLKALIDKYTLKMCRYPITIHVNNITMPPRVAELEESKKDMEMLKREFESLRKLFLVILNRIHSRVEKVIVSDRVFDLTSYLSLDAKTLEINPRIWIMEELRLAAELNPEDEYVVRSIRVKYLSGTSLIQRYDMKHGTSYFPRFGLTPPAAYDSDVDDI